jgi:hypothetical protein
MRVCCILAGDGDPKCFASQEATEILSLRSFIGSASRQHAIDAEDEYTSWGKSAGQLLLEVVEKTAKAPPDTVAFAAVAAKRAAPARAAVPTAKRPRKSTPISPPQECIDLCDSDD